MHTLKLMNVLYMRHTSAMPAWCKDSQTSQSKLASQDSNASNGALYSIVSYKCGVHCLHTSLFIIDFYLAPHFCMTNSNDKMNITSGYEKRFGKEIAIRSKQKVF